MKLRPFLAVVLAVALSLLGLGVGGWVLLARLSPLGLQRQPLTPPALARFVPRQAPLALYWHTDAERAVAYARAVAPPRQRRAAADTMAALRDGAFAAAGLDYHDELAGWLGSDLALAITDPASADGPSAGWLLALRGRDGEGARRFLQRFWQTRSLAGLDLQVSRYRGVDLISGRGALLGQDPQPLATALIGDDLVLIASGRTVLERALDASQIEELHQGSLPALRRALAQADTGVALLVARPAVLGPLLGLPLPARNGPERLVAAMGPRGRGLVLEARFEGGSPPPALAPLQASPLIDQLAAAPEALALLQDPAAQFTDPLVAAWLRPLLARAGAEGPLPLTVAQAAEGPLLLTSQSHPPAWLLATPALNPDPAALAPALAEDGLNQAPLSLEGRRLEVWSRLGVRPARGGRPASLQVDLAAARRRDADVAWWSSDLDGLDRLAQARRSPQQRRRLEQLQALAWPEAPLQWALGPAEAAQLLAGWQPWRLLTGVAAAPLVQPVSGLALAAGPQADGWRVRALLQLEDGDG
ncbi:MAG: DUF3352 domain-containing protein [Cyanobacteriota bacterium]|nr:DUF3352 domain-containing protein [Cyanobacteriota bacterium]